MLTVKVTNSGYDRDFICSQVWLAVSILAPNTWQSGGAALIGIVYFVLTLLQWRQRFWVITTENAKAE